MVVMNFESVGMGLMETGMAWFWPVHRPLDRHHRL
jgi:KDO2-lipid IV(A) lauroyltransferase